MRRLVAVTILLSVTTGFPVMGRASSLSVSPVHLTLSAQRPTAAINISTTDNEGHTIQLETVAWKQRHGKDIYTPTKDLLVTPPIFALQPGVTRIIRLGLRAAAPKVKESAYRLYIREVPNSPNPGFKGLRILLRIGIPVFVEPSQPGHPILDWQAQRLASGGLRIVLTNDGREHVHLANLSVSEVKGDSSLKITSGAVYLFPDQTRHWSIAPKEAASLPRKQLHLIAVTDQGQQQFHLAVEGR